MPLAPGTKIGPYEIVAPLGAGGMGEVYRATDTNLNRQVALKVLPPAFANDAERMARFRREAQTLASLNHPNIASIYGIEGNAIVMELVEGADLKGPLPLDEALPIARQIAEALEAAHEKQIVHRDLKPANIKITPQGVVKLLDFGLAKAIEAEPVDMGNSPTMSLAMTSAGMILGTAAYMSPEQARGKQVDRRADIWAFGVVLLEMLTGKQTYSGETIADTLAAVITKDPVLTGLPAGTPAFLKTLLERCLEKDFRVRLQSIGEARIAIEKYLANPQGETASPAQVTNLPRNGRPIIPWAVAAVAIIAAAIGWYRSTRPEPSRPLVRLNALIEPDAPLERGTSTSGLPGNLLALSPDGSRLAVTLRGSDGKVRLHTRLMNQGQVRALPGTENASSPFFSPAGDWIGFFADGKLKKIAVEGGVAVTLCDAITGLGGSWGEDGNIIAAISGRAGLFRVSAGGGAPVPATKLDPDEVTHRWPQLLPGGQAVLFTAADQVRPGGYDDANIDVVSLQTGERKMLVKGGFYARFLADAANSQGAGFLIYLHKSTLFAVPFDPRRLATTGSPSPVLEDVSSLPTAGGDFAFSQNGTFVYLSGKAAMATWAISYVDSSGKTQPLHAPPGDYSTPRFSPDGKRLAFGISSGKGGLDIWVKDLDRDTPSRLTFLSETNMWPVWTPDGKYIVFRSRNRAAPGLYGIRSDGSGEAKRLSDLPGTPFSFSPDGKRLAISTPAGNDSGSDIFTLPVESDSGIRLGKPELFLGTPFTEASPAFSPDGRWIAYSSNESGIFEVYVRPFPGPGGRWQISTGGGIFPVWSRRGHEMFFETTNRAHVMAVSYSATGGTFTAAKPRPWAAGVQLLGVSEANFDIAPDGKRIAAFVASEANEEKLPTHLTFLLNFYDELKRKAP